MTSRMVRWRSVRPAAPSRAGGVLVLSVMEPNLAGILLIIKHVFDRVADPGPPRPMRGGLVGGSSYGSDTPDQMFEYRTCDRVHSNTRAKARRKESPK